MDKDLMKFWITCPCCKEKFGIDPQIVIKYVDRLFSELGAGINKKADEKMSEKEPD